jgi:hypothetical protein
MRGILGVECQKKTSVTRGFEEGYSASFVENGTARVWLLIKFAQIVRL